MPRGVPRCEQETIFRRADDEDRWIVYSCDPVWKRRLAAGRAARAGGQAEASVGEA